MTASSGSFRVGHKSVGPDGKFGNWFPRARRVRVASQTLMLVWLGKRRLVGSR